MLLLLLSIAMPSRAKRPLVTLAALLLIVAVGAYALYLPNSA